MKTRVHLRKAIAVAVSALLVVSPVARADDFAPPSGDVRGSSAVQDVRLTEHGMLRGVLVNGTGQGIPNQQVLLLSGATVVAQSVSDVQGKFTVRPPQPGLYQLRGGQSARILRAWTAAAAPPAAQPQVLLIEPMVVRGQHGHGQTGVGGGLYDGGVMQVLSNPWVFSGVVAAGIAIPVAIAADDNDAPGS